MSMPDLRTEEREQRWSMIGHPSLTDYPSVIDGPNLADSEIVEVVLAARLAEVERERARADSEIRNYRTCLHAEGGRSTRLAAELERAREALEEEGHGERGGFHRGDHTLAARCPGCLALAAPTSTEDRDGD